MTISTVTTQQLIQADEVGYASSINYCNSGSSVSNSNPGVSAGETTVAQTNQPSIPQPGILSKLFSTAQPTPSPAQNSLQTEATGSIDTTQSTFSSSVLQNQNVLASPLPQRYWWNPFSWFARPVPYQPSYSLPIQPTNQSEPQSFNIFSRFSLVSLKPQVAWAASSQSTYPYRQTPTLNNNQACFHGVAIPKVLLNLASEVEGVTGTPRALVLSISKQECSQLWAAAEQNPVEIARKLQTNESLGKGGCNFNNGWNCFGPGQFQVGYGYKDDPFRGDTYTGSRALTTSYVDGHKAPCKGTWEDYVDKIAIARLRDPKEIDPAVLGDAFYAIGLKLGADVGLIDFRPYTFSAHDDYIHITGSRIIKKPRPSDWTIDLVGLAATNYFGSSFAIVSGTKVYYKDEVTKRFIMFREVGI